MRFRVLTVGREFACGSGEIARELGRRLNWKVFDGELIDEIARRLHLDPATCRRADERVEGWLQRAGRGLWSATGEKGPAVIPAEALDADRMAELTGGVVEQLAEAGGCVIVGRGGNYILRGREDAFHVFLYAAPSWRVRRLQAQGVDRNQAEDTVHRRDAERAAYIRRYFGESWPRRQLCHLMMDASLGMGPVVETVLCAMGVDSNPRPADV